MKKRRDDVFQTYPNGIHFNPSHFCPPLSLLSFPVFCLSFSTVLSRYFFISVNSMTTWSMLKLPKIDGHPTSPCVHIIWNAKCLRGHFQMASNINLREYHNSGHLHEQFSFFVYVTDNKFDVFFCLPSILSQSINVWLTYDKRKETSRKIDKWNKTEREGLDRHLFRIKFRGVFNKLL